MMQHRTLQLLNQWTILKRMAQSHSLLRIWLGLSIHFQTDNLSAGRLDGIGVVPVKTLATTSRNSNTPDGGDGIQKG